MIPDPVFQQGLYAMNTVNGIGAARVDERIAKPSQRTDLLTKLMEARDETGKPLSREELISEALTQVVAGADTTSNSLCPIIFYIARDADVQKKLHTELDLELGDLDGVPEYSQIKNLP
jgi:benzoate 4-monooxygenase